MTKRVDFDNLKSSPLLDLFSGMEPAAYQKLSKSLLEASIEAQGLISDAMNAAAAPLSTSEPDPFGSAEAQSAIAAALVKSPEKAQQALNNLMQGWMELFQEMAIGAALPRDRRFSDPEWTANPGFEFMRRAWMLNSNWLLSLVETVGSDVDDATRRKARFFISQMVDAMAPTNLPATNPAALRALAETGGQNLIDGLKDARRHLASGKGRLSASQVDETAFELGKNVATTKGQVIFRNDLIEIIHYNPTRKKMRSRPLLIFPPWINKFYILDLQPANSMIGWLLSKRMNTFVVSWRSADQVTKDYTWDDYVQHGVLAALDAVTEASGAADVNAVGYCIGGTLLNSAMAHMAKAGDTRISSATFFATQSDFEHAGDLKLFTDEAGREQIGDVISQNGGVMPGEVMGETFNWLRPADLVWRYVVDNYMLGKPPEPFDLLYWNSDQTNIPGPTHTTYLREMYGHNTLSKGGFEVFGTPVSMADINVPVFMQASRSDHICPWESIYRGAQNYSGDVTFMLAGSGHIAGVINHPDAKKYQHWVKDDLPESADAWLDGAEEIPGSWWPSWWAWLKPFTGDKVDAVQPKPHGLGAAPGQYAALKLADIAEGAMPKGPNSKTAARKTAASKKRKPQNVAN